MGEDLASSHYPLDLWDTISHAALLLGKNLVSVIVKNLPLNQDKSWRPRALA